jgi:hypothetical protein
MLRVRLIAGLFTLLTISASHVIGETPGASLIDEDRQLFAWFDELGIEDLSKARLVRVYLGKAHPRALPGPTTSGSPCGPAHARDSASLP